MSQKIPQRMRLKDTHPTMIKLMKLYDLAEELKLTLMFDGPLFLQDGDQPDLHGLEIQEVDMGGEVCDFPPTFEFKATYRNPKYEAEQKRIFEEQTAKIHQLAEQGRKEKAERLAKEAEERRAEAERKERAELVRLKTKYGE
jgi:hypothetical protein